MNSIMTPKKEWIMGEVHSMSKNVCSEMNRIPVKEHMYRTIFHEELNFGFQNPKEQQQMNAHPTRDITNLNHEISTSCNMTVIHPSWFEDIIITLRQKIFSFFWKWMLKYLQWNGLVGVVPLFDYAIVPFSASTHFVELMIT